MLDFLVQIEKKHKLCWFSEFFLIIIFSIDLLFVLAFFELVIKLVLIFVLLSLLSWSLSLSLLLLFYFNEMFLI